MQWLRLITLFALITVLAGYTVLPATAQSTIGIAITAAGASSGLRNSATVTLDSSAPERHDPGNLPVLDANPRLYLPIIFAG